MAEERGSHMAKLTKMQQKIYDFIAELLALKGITPEAGVTYRCAR